MLLTLRELLSREVVLRVLSSILRDGPRATRDARAIVKKALSSNPLFMLGVRPLNLSEPTFRFHQEGMKSEEAIDDAIIAGYRADVGIIVFLSELSSYDGGELVVDTGWGEEKVKESAGDCVVYPASARHRMTEVTRGSHWTAELSAQSLIRHPAQREILYDLGYSLHLLELFGGGQTDNLERLKKCQENLLRLWAEP
jgi:PKHD-type hydroxylase